MGRGITTSRDSIDADFHREVSPSNPSGKDSIAMTTPSKTHSQVSRLRCLQAKFGFWAKVLPQPPRHGNHSNPLDSPKICQRATDAVLRLRNKASSSARNGVTSALGLDELRIKNQRRVNYGVKSRTPALPAHAAGVAVERTLLREGRPSQTSNSPVRSRFRAVFPRAFVSQAFGAQTLSQRSCRRKTRQDTGS